MKTRNIVLAVVALVCGQAHAQSFDTYFEDNTPEEMLEHALCVLHVLFGVIIGAQGE